ncbi:MAG: hypothetical protein JOS17DRAFT_378584 [Linnemannia elongata]|nr:MAG: hypothetical protein JOS17DRAFT_378584 [Linnemannia elongata]
MWTNKQERNKRTGVHIAISLSLLHFPSVVIFHSTTTSTLIPPTKSTTPDNATGPSQTKAYVCPEKMTLTHSPPPPIAHALTRQKQQGTDIPVCGLFSPLLARSSALYSLASQCGAPQSPANNNHHPLNLLQPQRIMTRVPVILLLTSAVLVMSNLFAAADPATTSRAQSGDCSTGTSNGESVTGTNDASSRESREWCDRANTGSLCNYNCPHCWVKNGNKWDCYDYTPQGRCPFGEDRSRH